MYLSKDLALCMQIFLPGSEQIFPLNESRYSPTKPTREIPTRLPQVLSSEQISIWSLVAKNVVFLATSSAACCLVLLPSLLLHTIRLLSYSTHFVPYTHPLHLSIQHFSLCEVSAPATKNSVTNAFGTRITT